MTDDEYVKGLSVTDIEARALAWRYALGVGVQWMPDMVDILERTLPNLFGDFALVVHDDQPMGDAEAYTQFSPPRIVLRETVYEGANRHNPRCRMTLAHELGHLVLHSGLAKPRETAGPSKTLLKPYNSAEWQARKFAALFLLPTVVVREFGSSQELAVGCGVSLQAATIRFREVGNLKPPPLPEVVVEFLGR